MWSRGEAFGSLWTTWSPGSASVLSLLLPSQLSLSLSLSRLPGLTGCLSPQLLIKLKTQTSTEYFLEACSREERDAWAFEITGAIHAGQPGKVQQLHLLRSSFRLPPHISLQCVPGPALALPGSAAASAVCPPQEGPGCCCSDAPGPVDVVFSRWEWPCQPALVTSWGPCCSCPLSVLTPSLQCQPGCSGLYKQLPRNLHSPSH